MAEISSSALVGGFPLRKLYSTCITLFARIQLRYTPAYEPLLRRLSLTHLRLSRWGAAVHILGTPSCEVSNFPIHMASAKQLETTHNLLNGILGAFQEAKIYADKPEGDERRHQTPRTEEERAMHHLRFEMRILVGGRMAEEGNTEVIKENGSGDDESTWMLYTVPQVQSLTNEVNDLVQKLIDLFPEAARKQEGLCEEEVVQLARTESTSDVTLSMLVDAAKDVDDVLAATAKRAYGKRDGLLLGSIRTHGEAEKRHVDLENEVAAMKSETNGVGF